MYLFVGWQNKETSDYNKGKTNAQQPECRKDETNAELLKRCRNKTNEEREEQAEAQVRGDRRCVNNARSLPKPQSSALATMFATQIFKYMASLPLPIPVICLSVI